jgi:hypothetical protein
MLFLSYVGLDSDDSGRRRKAMRIYRYFWGGYGNFCLKGLFFSSFPFFEKAQGIWIIPLVARVQVNATDELEKQTHCDVARERECGFCRVIKWPPT